MRADISQPSSVRKELNLQYCAHTGTIATTLRSSDITKAGIYYSINNSVSRTSQTSETVSDGRRKTSGSSTCHPKRTMDIGSDSNAHRLTVRVGLSPLPPLQPPTRVIALQWYTLYLTPPNR